jgi:hypothetical protein
VGVCAVRRSTPQDDNSRAKVQNVPGDSCANLLGMTSGKPISDALRQDFLAYYGDLERGFATKKDPEAWQKVLSELDRLKPMPTGGEPKN